jgi:PKD domain
VIAAGALAAALTIAAGPQWSAPTQLSYGDRAVGPELAMNAHGDAIVVWDQEVGADCSTTPASLSCIHIVTVIERSRISGWSTIGELGRPGVGSRPRPAIDDSGDAAVIWVHDIGVDRVLQGMYRIGPYGVWPNASDLSDYVLAVTKHEVALGNDGTAYVSWLERTDSGVDARYERRFAGIWEGGKKLSDNVIGGPALSVGKVAWTEPGQTIEAEIPNSGRRTDIGGAPSGDVDLAANSSVVFTAGDSVSGALCCGLGYPWPNTAVIGPARDAATAKPQVASNGVSTVAVWAAPNGIDAADGDSVGGTWSSPTTLAPGRAARDPQVAVDATGNAVAVWSGDAGTVQAAIRPAATRRWNPAVTLSDTGGSSPRIAIDADGTAFAVWNRTIGDRVTVESAELSNSGPVVRLLVPKTGRARRRVPFQATAAPWASPIAGMPTWRFGDGKSGTGWHVTHAYARAGRYTVTVTEADERGGATTAKATIRIVRRRAACGH